MKVQAESIHLNGHITGSCADSKVRLALQNSIKHSGSEGVNSHRQLEQGKEIFKTKSRIGMIQSSSPENNATKIGGALIRIFQ